MAPNGIMRTGVLNENDEEISSNEIHLKLKPDNRKPILVWRNIILFIILHIFSFFGLYSMFTSAKLATTIQAIVLYQLGQIGITAGAHRLWSHRSYKAKWPLRLILALMDTIAFEDPILDWARDHRVHHKYSETDADPHNAKRGFFFSHIGWVLCRKHPEIIEKGKKNDISDLWADPIISYQKKYFLLISPLISIILPTWAPMYFWGETYWNSMCVNLFRYCFTLHAIFVVNSFAHLYGNKPYDKNINPSENALVSLYSLGEGWHNYHHTFPWDYKASELGQYRLNFTLGFIDFFAKIGWAYDLKTVSADMIKNRVNRTGDGSHAIWGWGDKDQPKEDYDEAIITYRKDD